MIIRTRDNTQSALAKLILRIIQDRDGNYII
jgi:hypothetical protein